MPLIGNYVDTFPGTTLAGGWVANGAGIAAGQAYVNASTAAGAPVYSSLRRAGYTFAGSSLAFEVKAWPGLIGDTVNAQAWVMVDPAVEVNRLGFEYVGAANRLDLIGQTTGYAPIGTGESVTYDPIAMRWLRLRHTGTTIVWETSPDGLTWTVRRTLAQAQVPAWALGTDTLTISFEAYRTTGTNDTFRIDNLNNPPGPVPTTPTVGTDALQRRTLTELRAWRAWLTANSAQGFVGEFGGVTVYGEATGEPAWTALLDAYVREAEVLGLHTTAWASGREWGNGYPLGVHVGTAVGDPLTIANAGPSVVLAAHPTRGGRFHGVNLAGHERGVSINGGAGSTVRSSQPHLHDAADFAFLAANGVDTVRLPLAWERLQLTLGAALDTAALAALDAMLMAARQVGVRVILDLHNYGRYTAANGTTVSALGGTLTNAQLSDVWTKLSTWVKAVASRSATVVAYGLMNEPHDFTGGAATWETASQAALSAIRGNADTRLVLVAGYTFSSLTGWATSHPAGWITDSAGAFAYEAHHYWDTTSALGSRSGTYQQSSTGPILTYAQELAAAAQAENAQTPVQQPVTVVRRNLCPNPALANDATGWQTRFLGATITVTTSRIATGGAMTRPWAFRGVTTVASTNVVLAAPRSLTAVTVDAVVSGAIDVRFSAVPTAAALVFMWYSTDGTLSTYTTLNIPPSAITANAVIRRVAGVGVPADTVYAGVGVRWSSPDPITVDVTAAHVEQASDTVLPYRDGDSPGWAWTGTAGASPSSITYTIPTTRRNIVPNPALAVDAAGWSSISSATPAARAAATGLDRPWAWQVAQTSPGLAQMASPTVPVTPGARLTVTCQWRFSGVPDNAYAVALLAFVDVNGDQVASSGKSILGEIVPGTPGRLLVVASAPLAAAAAFFQVLASTVTAPITVQMTAVRIEAVEDDAMPYRDGDSYGWAWDATSGASTSSTGPDRLRRSPRALTAVSRSYTF